MKPLFRGAVAAIVCGVVAASSPCDAQTASDPPLDAAMREEARAHFQRGVALIESERWAEAITELAQAQRIRVTAPVMYNLGLAHRAVGHNLDAMRAFREFQRLAGATAAADVIGRVDGFMRELSAGLGRVRLDVEPATARVLLDGAPASANGSVEVDPGRHVVVAEAEGFATDARTVEVPRGAAVNVTLRMVPQVLAVRVTVRPTPSSALVRIDGDDVGFGDVEETVRPGTHTLDVTADGHRPFHRSFEAIVGQPQVLRANLASADRSIVESPWFWTGVGVVAVGAGIAAWFLLQDTEPPYQGTLGSVSNAITVGGWR